jgi:predicted transcriptional regulator
MDEHECKEKIIRLEEKLSAAEKALDVAYKSLDSRLQGMNEFRQALTDQAASFITRKEHDIIVSEIRELREFKAAIQGKASQSSVWIAWFLAALGIMIQLLHWVK